MSGPDVVTIRDMTVSVADRQVDTVSVGYTQITSEGSHTHTAAQVGADPAGAASTALADHLAASDPHPAYLTQAEADGRYRGIHPMAAAYGLVAASGDPMDFMGNSAVPNNTMFFTRAWVPAGAVLTNLWAAVRSTGTHEGITNPNQLAVYDDAGALVGATADDPALWSDVGWRGGPIAGGPIAASTAGRFVYFALLARGITGGSLAFLADADDGHAAWFSQGPGGGNRRGFYLGGSSLPGSINPAADGTATTFLPLLAAS